MEISVSILGLDYSNIQEKFLKIEPHVDLIHLDVMDGVFVPNISFGPSFIKSIRKLTNKPFDTHLMIQDPIKYIKVFKDAGSNFITFHVESDSNPLETIKLIKSLGIGAGISIKPNTNVDAIKEYLPLLDMVLIMSVEPGFGGQSFMPNSIEKAKELKELKDKYNYKYLINIDGGINDKTIGYVKDYIDIAVAGSYITNKNDNFDEIISKLK